MFYWRFNEVNRIRTAQASMSSRLLLARYLNFKNRYHFFFSPPDWMRRRCLPELFMYFFRPLVWVENQVSCHRWCFSHFIYCGTHIFHCFSTLLKHWRWHESVFCVVWWDIFIWSDWDNRSEVIPICGRSIRTNYRWSHYILALSYCMLCKFSSRFSVYLSV